MANRRAKSGRLYEDPTLEGRIKECLSVRLSPIIAGAVLRSACGRCSLRPARLCLNDLPGLIRALERSLGSYLEPLEVRSAVKELIKIAGGRTRRTTESFSIPTVIRIQSEMDIQQCRTKATELGKECGLSSYDAIKVATVVSELTRNVLQYAEEGSLTLQPISGKREGLRIVVSDTGPGIANLNEVLKGTYRSLTGLGRGLRASRRIMDEFNVLTSPERGTTIVSAKFS